MPACARSKGYGNARTGRETQIAKLVSVGRSARRDQKSETIAELLPHRPIRHRFVARSTRMCIPAMSNHRSAIPASLQNGESRDHPEPCPTKVSSPTRCPGGNP